MSAFEGKATVNIAGPAPTVISILLGRAEPALDRNGQRYKEWPTPDLWFTAPYGKEREFLAVAIAAITSKRRVWVGTDDAVNWGVLGALYLIDEPSE